MHIYNMHNNNMLHELNSKHFLNEGMNLFNPEELPKLKVVKINKGKIAPLFSGVYHNYKSLPTILKFHWRSLW
jgi:hypothetical protein